MGLLSSVARFVGSNIIKPLATSAIQAIAPKAVDLLKNVVGTGFDVLKFGATKVLPFALPGPLGLAAKLLAPLVGKGIDALKGLSQQGVENLVRSLVEKIAPRQVPGMPQGYPQVTLPPFSDRATNVGASTAAMNTGIQAAFPGAGGDVESSLANAAAGLKEPAFPGNNASEGQMLQYQTALQKYARLMDMYSKIIQAHHDMKKGIIANFRV